MVTRRTVLLGSGAVAGSLAAGGCLGTDPSPDEPGDEEDEVDDEEEYPFTVDRLEFTTERTEEFEAYTPQPGAVYRDGDVVWIYVEMSNVTPVSAGPHLESTWAVVGSDDENLTSFDESIEIADGTFGAPPNEAFVTQGIDTSELSIPESGEYTATVTLTDVGSDVTDDRSETFTLERFGFESVVFTANEPEGVREYEEQPDNAYTPGDTVWLYVGVENVPVDSAGTATLRYTFDVETPDGSTWESVPEREESWERVRSDEVLIIWEAFSTYEDDPVGEYGMTITVEDQTNGQVLETEETFELT